MTASDWRRELLDLWQRAQGRGMVGDEPAAHLRHAETLAGALDEPERALDLGSGAGIPGLALAGVWPRSRWWLVDASRRRSRFLTEAVDQLGWGDRVTVRWGRAEDLGRDPDLRATFDLVTSRSFGPPAVAAECGTPFLREGGVLAVTEPPGQPDRWAEDGLALLGLERLPVVPHLQRFRRTRPLDERFPRRAGVPAKRPLF